MLLGGELALLSLLVLDYVEQRLFDVVIDIVWNQSLQVTKLSIVKVSSKLPWPKLIILPSFCIGIPTPKEALNYLLIILASVYMSSISKRQRSHCYSVWGGTGKCCWKGYNGMSKVAMVGFVCAWVCETICMQKLELLPPAMLNIPACQPDLVLLLHHPDWAESTCWSYKPCSSTSLWQYNAEGSDFLWLCHMLMGI